MTSETLDHQLIDAKSRQVGAECPPEIMDRAGLDPGFPSDRPMIAWSPQNHAWRYRKYISDTQLWVAWSVRCWENPGYRIGL